MRCLTLADCLRERNAQVRFVCADHPGNAAELLQGRGMHVELLPRPGRSDSRGSGEDYAEWLGTSQGRDAEQTIQALRGVSVDWFIVDHYGLDVEWEEKLRGHAGHVVAIDDLANRRHDCELLVDQNFSAATPDRYLGLVPAACRRLLGPDFSMLRPEFRAVRQNASLRSGEVRRVLVFFGGSDPFGLTGLALRALSAPEFGHIEVDVVIGINNPHREALERDAAGRPRTRLLGPQPHLADLMTTADLAVGAGGVTTWERMCVGLPSIVVSIAENQLPACVALAKAALILYAGHYTVVSADSLRAALHSAITGYATLSGMATRGQALVDGWGSPRITECLVPSGRPSLQLRAANQSDEFLYFRWVNEPEVRAQSIHTQPVPLDGHRKWFAAKLASADSRLFVMEASGLPVGQIRFEREGHEQQIDYSIDWCFRGRGWARHLVSLGMAAMSTQGPTVFRAEVKKANLPSLSVFFGLGFSESVERGSDDLTVFRSRGDLKCE